MVTSEKSVTKEAVDKTGKKNDPRLCGKTLSIAIDNIEKNKVIKRIDNKTSLFPRTKCPMKIK